MEHILKVFSKELETTNGGKFMTYYGYRQELTSTGEYTDIGTPTLDAEGKPIVISKPIKVKFSKEFYDRVKDLHFPLLLTLDDSAKLKDGSSAFFVCIDKDKDKKSRVDKNGKRHLVCVIQQAKEVLEAPMQSLTLEDLDDFQ